MKVSKVRITPEEDIDRLAERLWQDYGDDIEDIDSYNVAFNEFFNLQVGEKPTKKQDTILRKEVFKSLEGKHPSVVEEHLYPSKGRRKKAEYFEDKRKAKTFIYIGFIYDKKTHISKKVFTREETLTYKIKDKEIKREILRDRFGRFASKKSFKAKKGIKVHQVV